MSNILFNQTRQWLKNSPHPLARRLLHLAKAVRNPEIPAPGWLFGPAYGFYRGVHSGITSLGRILWWTPLFKGRLQACGDNLYLYGGLPYLAGPLSITFGQDCRVSGQTTITGRTSAAETPRLSVGNNVDLGWMTTIAVGSRVILGDNVRIAGRALLAGYPGHPLDAAERAAGLPERDEQVGDIVLENDVWLATGVSVMAGVTIGRGTVVAAGSVVTRDLPPGVLAGGVPARIIRPLDGALAQRRAAA
jgi:acetyltransferase-like isoleucine patch superfamily enzyme